LQGELCKRTGGAGGLVYDKKISEGAVKPGTAVNILPRLQCLHGESAEWFISNARRVATIPKIVCSCITSTSIRLRGAGEGMKKRRNSACPDCRRQTNNKKKKKKNKKKKFHRLRLGGDAVTRVLWVGGGRGWGGGGGGGCHLGGDWGLSMRSPLNSITKKQGLKNKQGWSEKRLSYTVWL